jgi:hypothetical protein
VITASRSQDASARQLVGPVAPTWALRGAPVEDRQLAEELAGSELADGLSVAHDTHRTRHDDEEAGPDLAFAHDDAAGSVVGLDGPIGDPAELVGFEALEQRRRGEQFTSFGRA